jgi:hypothetical protein
MRIRALLILVLGALSVAPLAAQTTGVWSTPTRTQQVDPERMNNPEVVARPGPLERMLVGTWELWVPGGVWYSSDGLTVYRNYTPGAVMNRLSIRADGGYRWGDHEGRLVEIRPWFAQEGDRYFAVAMDTSNRYMARWDGSQKRLLLFFWGVGGHAATGTRIGQGAAIGGGEKLPAAAADRGSSAMALLGTWRHESLQVRRPNGEAQEYRDQVGGTFTLRADGTFAQELRIGAQQTSRSGTYRVEGGMIRLQNTAGSAATLRFTLEGGRLWLEEEKGGTRFRYGLDRDGQRVHQEGSRGAVGRRANGSQSVKVEPLPNSLATVISPPSARAILSLMVSPMPAPFSPAVAPSRLNS